MPTQPDDNRPTYSHISQQLLSMDSRLNSVESKIDILMGKFDMIETFLLSPKQPYMTNVSPNFKDTIKSGSVLGVVASVIIVFFTEILPRMLQNL